VFQQMTLNHEPYVRKHPVLRLGYS
jgi:hypothetical protein